METTLVNCSTTSADWSGATSKLAPETQIKLQKARNQLEHLERTGNSQYAYFAIQILMWITRLESDNWSPETDHALENRQQKDE